MPSSKNLAKGIRRERELARRLQAQGYAVARLAASKGAHGAYDLIATNCRKILYISVKSSRNKYMLFPAAAIRRLQAASIPHLSTVERWMYAYQPHVGWHAKKVIDNAGKSV